MGKFEVCSNPSQFRLIAHVLFFNRGVQPCNMDPSPFDVCIAVLKNKEQEHVYESNAKMIASVPPHCRLPPALSHGEVDVFSFKLAKPLSFTGFPKFLAFRGRTTVFSPYVCVSFRFPLAHQPLRGFPKKKRKSRPRLRGLRGGGRRGGPGLPRRGRRRPGGAALHGAPRGSARRNASGARGAASAAGLGFLGFLGFCLFLVSAGFWFRSGCHGKCPFETNRQKWQSSVH